MIRSAADDWLFLLKNGPLTVADMVDLLHRPKQSVYRAMLRHEKRGNVCRLMGTWTLDTAGRERVEKLLECAK